jgi:predicted alpha/beta superfamily hydrolase
VLYLHDGQNCFNASTSFAGEWNADETAGKLIADGKIEPIIMVAIANAGTARIDEYTPTATRKSAPGARASFMPDISLKKLSRSSIRTFAR